MAWQSRFDDFAYLNESDNSHGHGLVDRVHSRRGEGTRSYSSDSSMRRPGRGEPQQREHLLNQDPYFSNSDTNRLNRTADSNADRSTSNVTNINNLDSEGSFASVIGLIISKESPKSFFSKKGTGSERHLISFTIRDDVNAFINITCWGGPEFAARLSENFKFGDVVEVKGAQVQSKSKNPADEKFKPWTPSSFCLNLSENHGEINLYYGMESDFLANLLHIPIRDSNDFYTLEDIQANGMNLHTEHINIFALVKKIWPARELVTKTGKKTSKVDVVICDETCLAFQFTLWDNFVSLSQEWIPLQTVLFAADVRISYSDFHSAMVACTDSKTILTVDPDTAEAQALGDFGRTQIADKANFGTTQTCDSNRDPEISSITNVLKVRDVKMLQQDLVYCSGENRYGVLFGFLSHFDIDSQEKNIVKHVCPKCHRSVETNAGYNCSNTDCSAKQTPSDAWPILEYSMSISLTDEGGSLESCYVAPSAMEQLLEYPASEFKVADQSSKTGVKWQYLFERVKAVLKISGSSSGNSGKSFIRVLALEKPLHSEVMDKSFPLSV